MKVHGSGFPTPNIMEFEISRKIRFVSMCNISPEHNQLFRIGTMGVERQIISEGISIESLPKLNAIISDQKMITFELDEEAGGYRTNLVFYPINFWIENQWSDYAILASVLEEYCHHFWNIEDEALVKRKVVDIMNSHIFNRESQVTLDQVYNIKWIEEYEYRRDNGLDLTDMH
ncbi:hypothetical protein [Exiguobacterium aestuarii]|uniref:hypothetical protein n=1 Tax=Exiguobacterium aestuarii TaxID=273527 RepID=UPI001CD5EA7B|nr:hypothetical protein [Exiguobacterium aestuarii]MCA0980251.1 hypothetical protein [Exiguobacterium aestuarii]